MRVAIITPQKKIFTTMHFYRLAEMIEKRYDDAMLVDFIIKFPPTERIEKIFFIYSSFWSRYKEIAHFIRNHPESTIYYFRTDYTVTLESLHRKVIRENGNRFIEVINWERPESPNRPQIIINLNAAVFDEDFQPMVREKKYDIIYYGMFRPGRKIYFERYLDDFFYVSASPHEARNFLCLNPNLKIIKKLNWQAGNLGFFKYSLYIEDERTHKIYNFPALRFYEALMNRVVLIFDHNCINTFNKAGYDISDYIVYDKESLKEKMKELDKDYDYHVKRQSEWRQKAIWEKKIAWEQIDNIVYKNEKNEIRPQND